MPTWFALSCLAIGAAYALVLLVVWLVREHRNEKTLPVLTVWCAHCNDWERVVLARPSNEAGALHELEDHAARWHPTAWLACLGLRGGTRSLGVWRIARNPAQREGAHRG